MKNLSNVISVRSHSRDSVHSRSISEYTQVCSIWWPGLFYSTPLSFFVNLLFVYCTTLSVGMSGPILAVYYARLITFLFSKYFQIFYISAQIFKYFVLFQHFLVLFLRNQTHALTSRIGLECSFLCIFWRMENSCQQGNLFKWTQ